MDIFNNNPNFDVIPTKDLSRAQWLDLRRQGIGGSDLAGIMGMSSYATPVDIYLDKTWQTETETEESPVMRRGRILEPIVANEYRLRYPWEKIIESPDMLVSREWPFVAANLDGIIIIEGKTGVFEIKTVGFPDDQWGYDGGDEEDIPERVVCQVLHYLAVTGFTYAVVVALFVASWELRRYFIARKEAVIQDIVKIEDKFWNGNVIPQEPPLPINSDDCNKLWMYDKGTTISANDEIMAAARELRIVKDEVIRLVGSNGKGGIQKELVTKIKSYMGDNEILRNGSKKIASWKTQTARRFQTKEFAKVYPELDKKFREESTSRVFRLGKGL